MKNIKPKSGTYLMIICLSLIINYSYSQTINYEFKCMTNENINLRFKCPSHWEDTYSLEKNILTLSGVDFEEDTFPDVLAIATSTFDFAFTPDYTSFMFQEITKHFLKNAEIIDSIKYSSKGLDMLEITFSGRLGKYYGQHKATGFSKDNKFYMITFYYEPSLATEKELIYKKIIKSIRIY